MPGIQPTGKERWRDSIGFNLQTSYGVRAVAFDSAGNLYTPASAKHFVVWNTLTGKHHVQPASEPHSSGNEFGRTCRAIDVTSDGQIVALAYAEGVTVTDANGTIKCEIPNHTDAPLEFNSDDRLRFGGHYSFVRFSPDGKCLAVVRLSRFSQVRRVPH